MSAVIRRFHDDRGASETKGALDTNADADDLKYTAANVEGRIQITASWYDDFGRLTDTVRYGTYAGSDLDRDGLLRTRQERYGPQNLPGVQHRRYPEVRDRPQGH